MTLLGGGSGFRCGWAFVDVDVASEDFYELSDFFRGNHAILLASVEARAGRPRHVSPCVHRSKITGEIVAGGAANSNSFYRNAVISRFCGFLLRKGKFWLRILGCGVLMGGVL